MHIKNSTIGWLWKITGRRKLYIVALSILQMIQGGSGVLFALLMRGVIDYAVAGDTPMFWRYVVYIVSLAAAQLAIGFLVSILYERCQISLSNAFKERLLSQLLRRDYASVSAVHTGEWINRLTSDTSVVAGSLTGILPGLLGMSVKLVSAMTMIVVLEKRFALLVFVGGIVVGVFTYFFRGKLKRLHKNVQEADGRFRVFLQERLGSLMVIHSFAAEKETCDSARDKLNDLQNARLTRLRFSNVCNTGFSAAMTGMYLLGVCWCGYGILRHTMTFGTLTAITQLIGQIQSPFANLSGIIPRYYSMIASAERLIEVEKLPEITGELLEKEEILRFYEERFSAIEMEDVSFAYYPPAENVETPDKSAMPTALTQASLEIPRGEIVALTGESGCGKSTSLKLLMGIYTPDSGRVFIREKGGETEAMSAKWRRLFAYVPQGNVLMRGTIREAITFGDPLRKDNDNAIHEALSIACAEDFVSELEEGIDTLLGERGAGLSEGQLQRLALARAVFSQSPVLLLDEATSALDTDTEKRLLENLRGMTDRTVVIITHRPAALAICDRVMHFTETGVEQI